MSRYKDFDAFESERTGEPVEFKIKGETFQLPATLPAAIPIKAMRLQKKYGNEAEIPQNELVDLSISMLGESNLQKLLDLGIDTDELGEIIQWLFEQYSGKQLPNA